VRARPRRIWSECVHTRAHECILWKLLRYTTATAGTAAAALVPQTTLTRGRIIYPFSMVVSGPVRKGVTQIVDIVPGVYIILCAICACVRVCVCVGPEHCQVCSVYSRPVPLADVYIIFYSINATRGWEERNKSIHLSIHINVAHICVCI